MNRHHGFLHGAGLFSFFVVQAFGTGARYFEQPSQFQVPLAILFDTLLSTHPPREYGKNGYTIHVVFKIGRSVWELFKRKDKDATNDDIVNILTAGGGGFLWDDQAKCLFRDGKRFQAQLEPGHPDFFFIKEYDTIAR